MIIRYYCVGGKDWPFFWTWLLYYKFGYCQWTIVFTHHFWNNYSCMGFPALGSPNTSCSSHLIFLWHLAVSKNMEPRNGDFCQGKWWSTMIDHDQPRIFWCFSYFSYIFRSPQRLGWNQQHILCGCGLRIIPLLCWGGNPERSHVFHPVSMWTVSG